MKKPVLTIIIIALNTFVGLLTVLTGANFMFSLFGMYQGAIANNEGYRVVTSSLIHANLIHYVNNMVCLWFFGSRLEQNIPRFKYFLIILIGTICSGLCINFIGGNAYHGGASGLVFGLFTAEFIRERRSGENCTGTLIALIVNIGVSFTGGVSWQGHLGGALGGLFAGALFIKNKDTSSMSLRQWKKDHPNCSEDFYYNKH